MRELDPTLQSPLSRRIVVDGVTLRNFAGCSYLDLAADQSVIAAAAAGARDFGMGADLGYSIVGEPIYDIERLGAEWLGFEAAVFCTSAYVACLVMAAEYASKVRHVFIDALSHYSTRHGLRIAGVTPIEFQHCSAADLAQTVRRHATPGEPILVMTDGVFPTWGDMAPVSEYIVALDPYEATIIVDDAHGTGVLGLRGAGILEHLQVQHRDGLVLIASFSKALGCQGALIGMSAAAARRVKSGNVIYNSISLPTMPTVRADLCAMRLAQQPERRHALVRAKRRLCDGLARRGIAADGNEAPIVTFSIGSAAGNRSLFDGLRRRRFLVTLSSYVAAPVEGAIRITLMASHTEQDVDELLDAIDGSMPQSTDKVVHASAEPTEG